jgi:hypothetical protein
VDSPFYVSRFFLTATDSDDTMKSWHFHTEIAHVDGYIEFVCKASAKDRIVWVVEVDDIEGHILYSCILLISEGDRQRNFPQGFNPFASKTD